MSTAVLLLITLALSPAISSNVSTAAAAATADADDDDIADSGDDGNSTTVVVGSSTSTPTSGEDAETVEVTGRNSTSVISSTVSAEDETLPTQTGEGDVQSLPPTSRTDDVSIKWVRVISPIFIALTTVGNPLSIITLQNPLFRFCIYSALQRCLQYVNLRSISALLHAILPVFQRITRDVVTKHHNVRYLSSLSSMKTLDVIA